MTIQGGSNISPGAVGRYHGRYEISRPIKDAHGFGKEDLTVALSGVREAREI
jgi:hypothetical protein